MSTSSLHLHSSSFESPKSVPPLLTRFGPVSSAVSSPSAVTVTNRPIARRSTPPSFFRRDDRFPFVYRSPYRQCRTLSKVANFYFYHFSPINSIHRRLVDRGKIEKKKKTYRKTEKKQCVRSWTVSSYSVRGKLACQKYQQIKRHIQSEIWYFIKCMVSSFGEFYVQFHRHCFALRGLATC